MRAAAVLGAFALSTGCAAATPDQQDDPGLWPTQIELPNGWVPEGIGIGTEPYADFGNGLTGAIYRADLRTGEGEIFSGPAGQGAGGIKVDDRDNLIFVAGCFGGDARVVDERSGELLKTYQMTEPSASTSINGATTCINDVVLTDNAAWHTDSFSNTLYKVAIGPDGELADAAEALTVTGDFNVADLPNGISTTPDGNALIVAMTSGGSLVRVDPATGDSRTVNLGGESVPGADGLLREGNTLYVAQGPVAKITLNDDGTAGTVLTRVDDIRFDRATTIAAASGDRLYLPNARPIEMIGPDTPYNAVAIAKP
jgi:streptogramin lyase